MTIINPLPYNIANGQAVDAVPVMADLNQIVSNVNANAAALAGSSSQVFNVANAATSTEAVALGQAQAGGYNYAADTGAANAYAMALTPAPAAITPGMLVGIRGIVAGNTGASTFNLNGLGALPIQGPGAAALQGGEFVAGGNAILRANANATAWDLVWTTGALPVASGAYGNQAVNLGQLQQTLMRNGAAAYNASQALTSADSGKIVFFTGAADGTFTLPASNSSAGWTLFIVTSNQSNYNLAIATAAGDTLDTSVTTLSPGQAACFINDGGSIWHAIWNEAGNTSPQVVGGATAPNHAVNLGQIHNVAPFGASNVGTGATYSATTASFTAPSNGTLLIKTSYAWAGAPTGTGATASASLGTLAVVSANAVGIFDQTCYSLPMTAGQATTVTATISQTSAVNQSVDVACFFIPTP